MTTLRTDFYLLPQADEAAQLYTVCRIVEKAYLKGHRLYIYCENSTLVDVIDKLLWTFHDISFIAHAKFQNSENTPVLIGSPASPLPPLDDILVNLSHTVPDFFNTFQRIIEVIPNNTSAREKARERYRFYRTHSCECHSHTLQ